MLIQLDFELLNYTAKNNCWFGFQIHSKKVKTWLTWIVLHTSLNKRTLDTWTWGLLKNYVLFWVLLRKSEVKQGAFDIIADSAELKPTRLNFFVQFNTYKMHFAAHITSF